MVKSRTALQLLSSRYLQIWFRGHQRFKITTNDTDVIVLPVEEFLITYGPGKNVQHMPTHVVALFLGPSKALALPMFQALTESGTSGSSYLAPNPLVPAGTS